MGNKADTGFIVARVTPTEEGTVQRSASNPHGIRFIMSAVKTFDARIDARAYAADKNKNLKPGAPRYRVIPTKPGPTTRLK